MEIDFANRILTYGLTGEEMKLLSRHTKYTFHDTSDCIADLCALSTIAIILNPEFITLEEFDDLIQVKADDCLFIFTTFSAKLKILPAPSQREMIHVCEIADEPEMGRLLQLADDYAFCYEKFHNYSTDKCFPEIRPIRTDKAEHKRVELHCHTNLSPSGKGLIEPTQLRAIVQGYEHTAVAITDYETVYAFPYFRNIAKRCNVKIIYGVVVNLFDEHSLQAVQYQAVLLAKNTIGLKNLYKLISLSHIEYFNEKPLLPKNILDANREGLLVGLPWENGELAYTDTEEQLVEKLAFYDYVEIPPHSIMQYFFEESHTSSFASLADIEAIWQKRVVVAERLNKVVVATSNARFEEPAEEAVLRVLTPYENLAPPLYFRKTEEMLKELAYLGEEKAFEVVVKNTNLIADLVDKIQLLPDELPFLQIEDAEKKVVDISSSRAKEIFGTDLPLPVQERLDFELDSIIRNGYASLYLTAHELAEKLKHSSCWIDACGGISSSYVAYLLGITEIDPIEHGISFEVVAGLDGNKPYDIGLLISKDVREEAYTQLEEMFGKERVFSSGVVGRLSYGAHHTVRKYFAGKKLTPYYRLVNNLANDIRDIIINIKAHPDSVVIVPKGREIYDFTPVQRSINDAGRGFLLTQFETGLCNFGKMEFHLREQDTLALISKLRNLTGDDMKAIPFYDSRTYHSLADGAVIGISEVKRGFFQKLMHMIKPNNFDDLVKIVGLIIVDSWCESQEKVIWLIESETVSPSDIITSRDDLLFCLTSKGIEREISYNIMERVRKGMGLTDEDKKAMAKANVPSWLIAYMEQVCYLPTKAEVIRRTLLMLRIAWFKTHHPKVFFSVCFEVMFSSISADYMSLSAGDIEMRIKNLKTDIGFNASRQGASSNALLCALRLRLEMIGLGL